jgi:hypothetical protein
MSVDLFDDSENKPIDLFAVKPSQEAFSFPVEEFHPSFKKEPLDEPAFDIPVVEQNVEVNPNNPEGTIVDVAETSTIPENVKLGMENADGITDTPLDPLPPVTEPTECVSLEEDLKDLNNLNAAYSALRFNGGISRSDVARIESDYPGLITKQKPLNAFSSVVSVCGYQVSCESIGDKIIGLIDRIIAGIGRIIDRLLNADRVSLPTAITGLGSGSTLESRWKDLDSLAARLDSVKSPKNIGARIPDSAAARKSSTLKHFVRLYPVELICSKVVDVAHQDLVDIDRNLERILNDVNRSLASGTVVSFPEVPVAEFRERYNNRVKGMVPNIEKIISIKTPDSIIGKIRGYVSTLNEIKRNVEKQRTTMVGNTGLTNTLKSVVSAIIAAEAYTIRMNICLDAYRRYNNVVGMSLDQTNTKLQMFKI